MKVEIERKDLFSVYMILMGIDFDSRNDRWERITKEVKRIMNETREK